MSGGYGVTPLGFRRKELATVLAEIEDLAIQIFGPEVIQTAQSPLGQLNGLYANLTTGVWELAEDIYQSFDADQSEGVNLDRIAKLRLIARTVGEGDVDLRRAITNLDRANIDVQDLVRAVKAVEGVSYAYAFVNDGDETDARGITPHAISVAVLGGDDAAVAGVIRRYVVPGVSTSGTHIVETAIDGLCRSIRFTRVTEIPISLAVKVREVDSPCACQPPSVTAIRDTLAAGLTECPLINGETLTQHRVSVALSAMPNVQLVSVEAQRPGGAFSPLPFGFAFTEVGRIAAGRIEVAYAT